MYQIKSLSLDTTFGINNDRYIHTKMAQEADTNDEITLLATPVQGKADWRSYRAFRLPNGVTCLAVHDKESKTTGMACSVNVGAAADPRSLSGLAHFCEHMW